jgi:hypothetical protein
MKELEDVMKDWAFLRKAIWKHKFAILPHRCRISKKIIWLKKGYEGTATYTGPGTPVTETHWHTTGEHIKWILTKDSYEDLAIIIPMTRKKVPLLIAKELVSVQPMTDIFKKDE